MGTRSKGQNPRSVPKPVSLSHRLLFLVPYLLPLDHKQGSSAGWCWGFLVWWLGYFAGKWEMWVFAEMSILWVNVLTIRLQV